VWAPDLRDSPPVPPAAGTARGRQRGCCSRRLAKAPADRYDSCLEFAAALRAACGIRPDPASDPGTQPGSVRQRTELAMPISPLPGTRSPRGRPATSGRPASCRRRSAGTPRWPAPAGPPTAAAGASPARPARSRPARAGPRGPAGAAGRAARPPRGPGIARPAEPGSTRRAHRATAASDPSFGLSPVYGPPTPRPPGTGPRPGRAGRRVAVAAIGGGGYVLFGNKAAAGTATTAAATAGAAAHRGGYAREAARCRAEPVNGKPRTSNRFQKADHNPVPHSPSHRSRWRPPGGKYTLSSPSPARVAVLKNGAS